MFPGIWAARTPDKPAIVMAGSGRVLTYQELEDRSLRLARHLHAAGLRRGDVVALLTDNRPEAYEVYWAALRSGLYVTAVNSHLSADEVAYIVTDCGAKALVVSAEVPAVASLEVDVAHRLAYGGEVAGHASYEAALAAAGAGSLEESHGDDLLYSSGTTGRPKGIRSPLPEITVGEPGYVYPLVFGTTYAFDDSSVYLSPAPVYHAAPLRFGGVVHAYGGTLVMMERFDAEQALATIERYGVTHTQMVPTMFVRMLKLPEDVRLSYDIASLRCVVHAAAPCPVEVKRRMIEWFGPIIEEYYASTEGMGATAIDSATWLEHPGSVGRPIIGVPHIVGEDGGEVGPGEVGAIYFERNDRSFAYLGDTAKTAAAKHPKHESWTSVGDVGYLDEDGFLYLTDRVAFTIISGGVNIYPQEIEDLFSLHPAVADIAVIGVPDEEMGERVAAFVQPAPGVDAGPRLEEELTAYARDRIAHYKVPREIHFRDSLPRTPTGKMVKRRLLE
ncbi:acyl-CoA synthetase [Nocardioides sp. NPDC101246]|uniref:acyl-CoA synthetase n=1 Tax=Nocardioides sp. NPDC101246 TaxID=3364336 RepID=UPI00380B68C8